MVDQGEEKTQATTNNPEEGLERARYIFNSTSKMSETLAAIEEHSETLGARNYDDRHGEARDKG